MLDIAFALVMLPLLGLAVARPFVGVLLWSYISFLNPHQLLWGFSATVPWAALVFCATVAGCVVAREPQSPTTFNAVPALLLALLVCFSVTSLFALGPPGEVLDKWVLTSKILLGAVLTALLLTDRRRIHALLWVMVISLGFFGLKGGLFVLATGGGGRVVGPEGTNIGDNNHLAAALLIAVPLMNYLRLHSAHRLVRLGLLGAMGLNLVAVLGTYSRGGLLGLLAAGSLLALRSGGTAGRRVVLAGALVAAVVGGIAVMPSRWHERMQSIETYEQDTSATDRLVLWQMAFQLALDRPLVGAGFRGPYTREVVDRVAPQSPARAVHSIWFELLGEHGFPTFLVWLSVIATALVVTFRMPRLTRNRPDLRWARDLAVMGQVSTVAYMVSGTFLSLSYWDFQWTIYVVLGATQVLVLRAVRAGARDPGARPDDAAGRPAGPVLVPSSGGGWRQRAAGNLAVLRP